MVQREFYSQKSIPLTFANNSGNQNTIRLQATSIAGTVGTQTAAFIIKIDTTIPGNITIVSPSNWATNTTPMVIVQVFFPIGLSGVNNASGQYAFSTTGQANPSTWMAMDGMFNDSACTTPALNGTTGWIYMKVKTVNFNQDSATLNTICFRAGNMAGSQGIQNGSFIIKINSTPPGNFSLVSPLGWVSVLSSAVVISFNDASSGANVTTVKYAYSNSGNLLPTNWASVSGVYMDINCTVSAASGYTGNCYAKINSVTFTQGTQNAIRLQVYDVAGNMANQTPSSIIQYDNTAPGSFALYSPTGYVNVQDPTVIMQFSMTGPSGINPSGVNYAFTTNGSSTPTNWQEVSGVYTDVNCINVAQMGQNGKFYAKF